MLPHWLPLNRTLAQPLIAGFVHQRISPNQITLLALLVGLAGGVYLLQGTWTALVVGTVGFWIANILDECDGAVARKTGKSSGLGSWLDLITDCLVHSAFFIGAGWGLAQFLGESIWRWVGVVATVGVVISYAVYVGREFASRGADVWRHPDPPDRIEPEGMDRIRLWLRVDFSVIALVAALLSQLQWILVGSSVGAFLFWIPADLKAAVRLRQGHR